jgi:hypothetical protein
VMVQVPNPFAHEDSRRSPLIPLLLASLFALALLSCGRKGSPTLKSYERPEKPSLVSVIHREDAIILTWDFPKDKENTLAGFIVLKSSGEGRPEKLGVASEKRSFRETDFQEGMTYRYRIVAKSLKGVLSAESRPLSIVPLHTPQPPGEISFSVADDSLLLRWKNGGKGILYNVYKTFVKGAYSSIPVNSVPLAGTSLTDVFYVDKKVYYTVRSLLNGETRDEGPPSKEIEVNPYDFVPPAPEDIGYFAAPDRVFLFWKGADEKWVTGYRVYRKIKGEDYTLIGETQIPSFLDNERPLTARDYRITALGPAKEGPPAEIKGVIYIPREEEGIP